MRINKGDYGEQFNFFLPFYDYTLLTKTIMFGRFNTYEIN